MGNGATACIYIYISNGLCMSTLPQKVLNTHMRGWLLLYDHGFMDVIPIVSQSKIDFIHKQVIRPLLHGGSHFVIYTSVYIWNIGYHRARKIIYPNCVYIYMYGQAMGRKRNIRDDFNVAWNDDS